jgi:hypothetical protein
VAGRSGFIFVRMRRVQQMLSETGGKNKWRGASGDLAFGTRGEGGGTRME